MKYMLSEGKEDKVALEKEISLIQNYTELERLRKTDASITFTITGNVLTVSLFHHYYYYHLLKMLLSMV